MAKGGGAWKVAYADFVTAMMAFFLVMWICAQDQKVKKAVADYFSNPSAIDGGQSTSPTNSGAMFDGTGMGSVPHAEKIARGKGRGSFSSKGKGSRVTNLVNNWLHSDEKVTSYWREQANKQRISARRAAGPNAGDEAIERAASKRLAAQLKQTLSREIPANARGLHKDLLAEITGDINWKELADDFLAY